MLHPRKPASSAWRALPAVLLACSLSTPAGAYDLPLSEESIRDAYSLGSRNGGLKPDFLAKYALSIPDLKQGTRTSEGRIETPFLQVADYSGRVPNYSAQGAVQDFFGKPMSFRIHLDVCYCLRAPANAIKIQVLQNKKIVVPESFESSPYSEPTDFGFLPPNGEQITLEFRPAKIDSSGLTIVIDTSDGQHAETLFELQSIR